MKFTQYAFKPSVNRFDVLAGIGIGAHIGNDGSGWATAAMVVSWLVLSALGQVLMERREQKG